MDSNKLAELVAKRNELEQRVVKLCLKREASVLSQKEIEKRLLEEFDVKIESEEQAVSLFVDTIGRLEAGVLKAENEIERVNSLLDEL